MRLIFDTHLDLAWNALNLGRDVTLDVDEINRLEQGMTDDEPRGGATTSLPAMRRGRVAACLGTIMARVRPGMRPREGFSRASLDYANPAMAYAAGQGQLAYYRVLEEQGHIRLVLSSDDLQQTWSRWEQDPADHQPVGLILALEGADPIVSWQQVGNWFQAGLRVASLAHYGPSRYAMGTGGQGPLTSDGVRLLAEMERLGVILDVSHLAEPGLSQALERFAGAVMASHSNCRALVPGDRQLSDGQIRRLISRGGVIGLALDAWMLCPGWETGRTPRCRVGLEAVADQIDHVCQLAGSVHHVGIGSDLDGGFGREQVPHDLESIADLQKLGGILATRGFAGGEVDAFFHRNWLRFFLSHLPKG